MRARARACVCVCVFTVTGPGSLKGGVDQIAVSMTFACIQYARACVCARARDSVCECVHGCMYLCVSAAHACRRLCVYAGVRVFVCACVYVCVASVAARPFGGMHVSQFA